MKHILEEKEKEEFRGKEEEEQISNRYLVFLNGEEEFIQRLSQNATNQLYRQFIRGRVSTKTIVHTDKWRGYDGLVDVGYDKHKRINHSKAFSYGNGTHINGIENFWSFTKGRLAKFRGTKVNFELHLKECEWRYKKTKRQLYQELIVLLKGY